MIEKNKYYIAIAGNGVTAGYVHLSEKEYNLIREIMDTSKWENVNRDSDKTNFYIGREYE